MNLRLLKKVQFICLGIFLMSAAPAFSQVNVSGKVTSADDHSPLTGVQVIVKGSGMGTITDSDGFYTLRVASSDVLSFYYLGYKAQEQPVGSRYVIDVEMEPDTYRMEDVVVMGYSSIKKAELTSSVVTLTDKQLTDVTTPDVGNMLQGKVAGVMVINDSGQPGSAANIRVRGIGSLNAASTPLFVVDGIPGGSYNANDIETLTVLKDVGATAIYGASGANGVIVITTKKAKMNQPIKVEFKANVGLKQALFGRFSPMNSSEAYYYQKSLYSAGLFASQKPKWLLEEDFDWVDATFGTGIVQNYYAAASGGSEKINYRASIDYYREKGTLINTHYNSPSARLNLNSKLARNLDLSIRLDYSENNGSSNQWATLEGAYRAMPWDNPYDPEGNPVFINSDTRPDRPASTPGRPVYNNKWWGVDKLNVFHDEEYNYNKSHGSNLMADVYLNWNILSWLSISSTNRFNRSMWNSTTFLDPQTKTGAAASNGSLTYSEGFGSGFSTSNLLKAGHTWGDHSVNGLLGWEWGEGKSYNIGLNGTGMPTGMDSFDSASVAADVSGSPRPTPSWSWSAFAQLQYSYASKYFVTAVFRADNSSVFAAKKRTGYFPAVSGAWIISNENFLKGNKALTFLKLRASYGQAGNDKIDPFIYLDAFDFSYQYLGSIGATPNRLANPYLHWETATTADAGLDINLYDRVEINVDYYYRTNSGLLMDRSLAPSTGFFSQLENIGEMSNTGLEIQLNSTNIRRKNFNWTTSFNFAYNTNKMTKLLPTPTSPDGTFTRGADRSLPQIIQNGYNIYTWFGPEWYGVDPDNGDPLWYDADGKPTNDVTQAADRYLGTAMPKFYGGLFNSLSWKWLQLDFNFAYNYGNMIFNKTRISMDTDGLVVTYNQMSIDNGLGWSRWEEEGDVATHPKLKLNGNKNSSNLSSRYLEDGSYLRLRNVTLSFNLPEKWLSKMKMSSARIYLSGDNLFTLTKYSGADPEVSLEKTTWSLPGTSDMNFPVGRVYSVGVDFSF